MATNVPPPPIYRGVTKKEVLPYETPHESIQPQTHMNSAAISRLEQRAGLDANICLITLESYGASIDRAHIVDRANLPKAEVSVYLHPSLIVTHRPHLKRPRFYTSNTSLDSRLTNSTQTPRSTSSIVSASVIAPSLAHTRIHYVAVRRDIHVMLDQYGCALLPSLKIMEAIHEYFKGIIDGRKQLETSEKAKKSKKKGTKEAEHTPFKNWKEVRRIGYMS